MINIYHLKMEGNESSSEVEEDDDRVQFTNSDVEDKFEDDVDMAKSIYYKLRTYIEFHGLDFLNVSDEKCISDLQNLL